MFIIVAWIWMCARSSKMNTVNEKCIDVYTNCNLSVSLSVTVRPIRTSQVLDSSILMFAPYKWKIAPLECQNKKVNKRRLTFQEMEHHLHECNKSQHLEARDSWRDRECLATSFHHPHASDVQKSKIENKVC